MNNSYTNKKVIAECDKCGKKVTAKESKYNSRGGKEVVIRKFARHKCK